jgi:hypothetical protein
VDPIANERQAVERMGEALWKKHPEALKANRPPIDPPRSPKKIRWWQILREFFSFLWNAVLRSPENWAKRLANIGASGAASVLQRVIFGGDGSAYKVVVRGIGADGLPASWEDEADKLAEVEQSLRGGDSGDALPGLPTQGTLWKDFIEGGITLADAGRRDEGLEPIKQGHDLAVVANAARIAPTERFATAKSLAASHLVRQVEPADALTAETLDRRLGRLAERGANARAAAAARNKLTAWREEMRTTYVGRVGQEIVAAKEERHREITACIAAIESLTRELEVAPDLLARLRRLAKLLRAFLAVAVVLAGGAVFVWAKSVVTDLEFGIGLSSIVCVWFVASLIAFGRRQSEFLLAIRKREADEANLARTKAILKAALSDHSRLISMYRQHLQWSKVLGEFLARPLGVRSASQKNAPKKIKGLAPAVRVGWLAGREQQLADTVALLRNATFTPGWLDKPFTELLAGARAFLREDFYNIAKNAQGLFGERADTPGSPLARWAEWVAAEGVGPAGEQEMWAEASSGISGAVKGGDWRVQVFDERGGLREESDRSFVADLSNAELSDARVDSQLLLPVPETVTADRVVDKKVEEEEGALGGSVTLVEWTDPILHHRTVLFESDTDRQAEDGAYGEGENSWAVGGGSDREREG